MGVVSWKTTPSPFFTPHRNSPHSHTYTMKWLIALATLAVLASSACAYEYEEAGDARLGFINVGSDGVTSLTFNATSIQNAVVLLLFLGLIGALIAPLLLLRLCQEVRRLRPDRSPPGGSSRKVRGGGIT